MNSTQAHTMYATASCPALEKTATLSVHGRLKQNPEYAVRQLTQKYDSYQGLMYHHVGGVSSGTQRRRLSSTGEGSGDSSTTTSGSSYGEREDGSEGRADSEEAEREDGESTASSSSGVVSENERLQLESFFKGLKTQVYVCGSLANLYVSSTAPNSEWELRYMGIPIVLLDSGETRSRDKRRIQILLAERGTCFTLWRDTIDNLSAYKVSGRAFHTMCLSSDHSQLIGFSFDTVQAAHDIWSHIERLVSCPENISLSVPGRKKKKQPKAPKPQPLPPKSHISQPCCFQHVTSVDVTDRGRYFSMQALLPILSDMSTRSTLTTTMEEKF